MAQPGSYLAEQTIQPDQGIDKSRQNFVSVTPGSDQQAQSVTTTQATEKPPPRRITDYASI